MPRMKLWRKALFLKAQMIQSPRHLVRFEKDMANFSNLLFCEGKSLGRRPNSLTSVQLYDAKSDTGYFIDIQQLRISNKPALVQTLKSLFHNSSHTFVFFDPFNDYAGLRGLQVDVKNMYCMKLAGNGAYASMVDMVQKSSNLKACQIAGWIKEKKKSRERFNKNDYSFITQRPLKPEHIEMALDDAYYLYVVYNELQKKLLMSSEQQHQRFKDIVAKTNQTLSKIKPPSSPPKVAKQAQLILKTTKKKSPTPVLVKPPPIVPINKKEKKKDIPVGKKKQNLMISIPTVENNVKLTCLEQQLLHLIIKESQILSSANSCNLKDIQQSLSVIQSGINIYQRISK